MRTLTKQSSIFSLFSRFKLEFLLSNSSLGVAGIAPLSRGLTCQLKCKFFSEFSRVELFCDYFSRKVVEG